MKTDLMLFRFNFVSCLLLVFACNLSRADDLSVDGKAVISAPLADSKIVIKTTNRLAGAIDSVRWRCKEFINSTDHGRQLQSASNYDAGSRMIGETFNPTEAGSAFDGAGSTSSSRLLHLLANGNKLQTTTQMAFWLRPGMKSRGNPAKNTTILSNHLLTKRVTIGYRDLPNVLQYDVTFSLPLNEVHRYAQFEAVTGYMPAEFSKFLVYNSQSEQFESISDGPGEQSRPVVLSTPDEKFAMGCFTPRQYGQSGSYGRFRFPAQKVVKWNTVLRIRDRERVEPTDYPIRSFVVLGDLEMVRESLRSLHEEFEDNLEK